MAATDTQRSEQYAEITRRIAEEAWGAGEFNVVDEYLADDFVGHTTAAPEDVQGVEEYKALISQFRSAMPDMAVEVEDSIAAGDRVAIRFTVRGTHEGDLMGIEPTGREVEGDGAVIVRFADDKVAEVWEYGDQLGLLTQLGVVDRPGA